jgi:enterochelin esterase-like enzyme
MRQMMPRQAGRFLALLALLLGLPACSTPVQPTATATAAAATSTAVPATSTPTAPPTLTPSATAPACISRPGRVESHSLDSVTPPQEFLIYLPPCYDELARQTYPVLYLLHGQTYTSDQWVRLGAAARADELILAGQAPPFIIVFPDDRYWNLPAGAGFGRRLIDLVIPHVDQTYRSAPDREQRALGGLSRGGGWTLRLGLTRWDLFGALGLHSPVVFSSDAAVVDDWIAAVPGESFPRLWLDIGDRDRELGPARLLEESLSYFNIVHQWHQYQGDHSEVYWGQHVAEYLRWYVQGWMPEDPAAPEP